MKKLIILLFLIVIYSYSKSYAGIPVLKVSPYQACPYNYSDITTIRTDAFVFKNEDQSITTVNVKDNVEYLANKIEKWKIEFEIAGDRVFSKLGKPICVGAYDDLADPNAQAINDESIVFGVKLMSLIVPIIQVNYETALKFILAHEFAHIIQFKYNLGFNYRLGFLSTKIKELQADCLAGMILEMQQERSMDMNSDLEKLIDFIGDKHVVGDHGLGPERLKAFSLGQVMAQGLIFQGFKSHQITAETMIRYCNRHYTATYPRPF